MTLEFTRRAVQQAERCSRWWREHRPSAPELFDAELKEALDLLRGAPLLGSRYQVVPRLEHRRLLMPGTRCHVYYRVLGPDRVRVVAVWSAVRGSGPRL